MSPVVVEAEVDVNRPPEEVFDYCSDHRHEPEWNPMMTRIAKLTGGPVGAGTRYAAEATVRECADLGIKRVWMHRGPGAGSVSHPSRRIRPPARHHRGRGRLPVHVQPHRRSRSQGDAVGVHHDGQRATARAIARKPRL